MLALCTWPRLQLLLSHAPLLFLYDDAVWFQHRAAVVLSLLFFFFRQCFSEGPLPSSAPSTFCPFAFWALSSLSGHEKIETGNGTVDGRTGQTIFGSVWQQRLSDREALQFLVGKSSAVSESVDRPVGTTASILLTVFTWPLAWNEVNISWICHEIKTGALSASPLSAL